MRWTTINKSYELMFFKRIKKTIDKKVDGLISVLKEGGSGEKYVNDLLTNPELTQEVLRLYINVGTRWADLTTRDLKKQERKFNKPKWAQFNGEYKSWTNEDGSFSQLFIPETKRASFGLNEQWIAFIRAYLAGHITDKITFVVNETLREHLLLVLNRAVEQGWGIDQTVRYLEQDNFTATQAARIARTEVNRAANAGVLAGGETYQYEMQKEWISVEDNRTRGVNPKDHANHRELNENKIDFNDLFVDKRNGDRLQAPGDPKASAASTINCRCQMGLSPKRDQNGRLIPKRQTTTVIYPNQNRPQRIITI